VTRTPSNSQVTVTYCDGLVYIIRMSRLDYSFEKSFVRLRNIAANWVLELVVYLLVNYERFELS